MRVLAERNTSLGVHRVCHRQDTEIPIVGVLVEGLQTDMVTEMTLMTTGIAVDHQCGDLHEVPLAMMTTEDHLHVVEDTGMTTTVVTTGADTEEAFGVVIMTGASLIWGEP